MTRDSMVLAGLGGIALLCLLICVVLAVMLSRTRSRTRAELAASHAETADLRAQIEEIERVLSAPARRGPQVAEYTITHLGEPDEGDSDQPDVSGQHRRGEPVPIDRALFADLVLRETVVRAASLAHGVRRALGAETRNRVRFEVKREIRRARKQRRADMKDARRDWEARQRAELDDENAA